MILKWFVQVTLFGGIGVYIAAIILQILAEDWAAPVVWTGLSLILLGVVAGTYQTTTKPKGQGTLPPRSPNIPSPPPPARPPED